MKPDRRPRRSRAASRPAPGRGFSLLEVVLALAILAGAVTVLGEVARSGMESARIARDLTAAQLLCESTLAEITAGATLPEPVYGVPYETVTDPAEADWLYSIEVEPVDVDGLVAVRVTVVQDLPVEKRPVEFSLVRWIVDPGVEMSADSSTDATGL